MKYIEILADAGNSDTITALAEQFEIRDLRLGAVDENNIQTMRLLVEDAKYQKTLDALQNALSTQPDTQIVVLPVEVSLPQMKKEERKEEDAATVAREELYSGVEKNARLTRNYFVLVVLSTIVAAIGLVENNVAVIIGAMVIAPLLGPNLALVLGTALGDTPLMKESVVTLLVGVVVAIVLSIAIGWSWPTDVNSPELLARTNVGLDSVALALASGAAAALSLTTGLSSTLVGVMVAVALLPPAATIGLFLGHGDTSHALGATVLLLINIVCVNLAGKVVFALQGITPRTWWEKEKAKRAMRINIVVWLATLVLLVYLIQTRWFQASLFEVVQ